MDPNKLRIPSKSEFPIRASVKPPRHKLGEKFLMGPIPWNWLTAAASQKGKALHVGIILWFLAGMNRKGTVAFSMSQAALLGMDRFSAYRGLKALEQAGLIAGTRHKGRNASVTLLEA